MSNGTNKPRIIVWDIETLPNLPAVLHKWIRMRDFMGLKADISTMICFGYKIHGQKKTHCLNVWDYPNWKKNINDDYELVKAAKEVLDSADAIVTHNGKMFDYKFLNTRLAFHGLAPLLKIPHIDTCMLARKRLYLASNRLDDLAKFLKLDGKMKHDGWDLWIDVHGRSEKAMKTMTEYCKKDVRVLDECFTRLKGRAGDVIPNHNHWRSTQNEVCPACGSADYIKWGHRITATNKFPRYRCKSCGTCFRNDKKDKNPRGY